MCMLERKSAIAGKRIRVRPKSSILGIILKEVKTKAEVVIVLLVNTNRLIYITFLKTLGRTAKVRSRNLITNQPM